MGTRVYIGRLSHRARERDVEDFFRGFGKIRDVILKNGYGFVEFDDHRDADDAVYELNGKDLSGERVIVEHAKGGSGGFGGYGGRGGGGRDRYGPPTRTDYRLIVENLSSRVSWQNLKDYMRQAGEVTYSDVQKHRNEGVIEFATSSDMRNAQDKLDGTELNGRKIRLIEEKSRKAGRSRSRSRSRSRRRSRSRSGSRSRSRSRSNSRSRRDRRSKSKSKSPRKSRSRSVSPRKSRSRSRSRSNDRGDGD